MKYFFVNLFLLFFIINLQAQITIERSDYPLELNDAAYIVNAKNINAATIPEAGEEMIWDFRRVRYNTDNVLVSSETTEGSDSRFPGANTSVTSTTVTNQSNFLGLNFDITFFGTLDEQGFRTIGQVIAPVTLPLGPNGDMLDFTETENHYEVPSVRSQFPMNYGDASEPSSITLNNEFKLTIAGFGLDNVPGNRQTIITTERSTIGWGKLLMKDPETGKRIRVKVLLVKSITTSVQNFFLGGGPAPAVLLTAFGLEANLTTTTIQYDFWAKGLKAPALRIDVADDGETITGVIANRDAGDAKIHHYSGEPVTSHVIINIAPNPAPGFFQVKFNKSTNKTWVFNLHNNTSQIVHRKYLVGQSGQVVVYPGRNLHGLHYYTIQDENGKIVKSGQIYLN